jgi:hypothetical protein
VTVPVAYQNNLSIRADRVRKKLCASTGPDGSGMGPSPQSKEECFTAVSRRAKQFNASKLCQSCVYPVTHLLHLSQ